MKKSIDNITDFFNYICNLDSEEHTVPSVCEVYGLLGNLTENFNIDRCEGALEDLNTFRENINKFMPLIRTAMGSDLGDDLSKNKQAIKSLYIDNQGIVTASLDINKMKDADQKLPLFALFCIAIKMRYSKLSFDMLDKVEKKLKDEIERQRMQSNQQLYDNLLNTFKSKAKVEHMNVDCIRDLFDILVNRQYIIRENGHFKCDTSKMSTTQLTYVLKKIYKENETVPWREWQDFLYVKKLANAWQQIKGQERDWYPEFDEIVKKAKGEK